MQANKTASPTGGRILYGMGGLSVVTEVAFLLLFLSEFAAVHEASLLVGCVAGTLAAVSVMPLLYAFINGNTAIATGRYHVALVVSGLVSALAFVLFLGVGGHPVAQAFALFGLTFLFLTGIQVFAYTYFSVGLRFDPGGAALKYKSAFSLGAVALVAVAVAVFMDGSRDGVRAVAAISGIGSVLGVVAAYFSSVQSMPAYLRLEPRHRRKIKQTYLRFVSPLRNGAVRRLSGAAFLLSAGAALAAATVPLFVFADTLGMNRGYKPVVLVMAGLIAAVGAATRLLRIRRKQSRNAVIVLAGVQLAAAAIVSVMLYVPVPSVYKTVAAYAFAALAGVTLGLMFSGESRNNEYAASLSGCSPGRFYCLRNCITVLGFSFGIVLATVGRILWAHVGRVPATVSACAVYAVFILAAALLERLGHADKWWTAPSAEPESVPAELREQTPPAAQTEPRETEEEEKENAEQCLP